MYLQYMRRYISSYLSLSQYVASIVALQVLQVLRISAVRFIDNVQSNLSRYFQTVFITTLPFMILKYKRKQTE